jgi:hypothetical protein
MAEQGKAPTQPTSDHQKSTEQRIADLELQLATVKATTPLGTIPDHGGGVGQEVEETWSQHDQELATKGEHPLQ